MSLLIPAGSTGSVEVDIEQLDEDENFFLAVFRGGSPDAKPEDAMDMRRKLAAMNHADIREVTARGLEKLIARGLFDYERDAEGNILRDAEGEPSYRRTGRLITRMKLAKRPNLH